MTRSSSGGGTRRQGNRAPVTGVAIVGMHRSGTSLMARMLRDLGFWLGPDEDLFPGAADNLDGFWENSRFVALNAELLNALGTDWDCPLPVPDDMSSLVAERGEAAGALAASLAARGRWAFKDPRTSLLLPFWRAAVPDLHVLLCVRHPFEVAVSLHRRNFHSYAHSLRLWQIYNERVLAATEPGSRTVVHYASLLEDPAGELARIASRLGAGLTSAQVAVASGGARRELRHSTFGPEDLARAGAPVEVGRLYADLCSEAGRAEEGRAVLDAYSEVSRSGSARTGLDAGALDLARMSEDLKVAGEEVAWREQAIRSLLAARRQGVAQAEEEARLAGAAMQETASRILARLEDMQAMVAGLESRLAEQALELHRLRSELAGRDAELGERLDAIEGAAQPEGPARVEARKAAADFRKKLALLVPAGARVLVASDGDASLLAVRGRTVEHFPQDATGAYAGRPPASSLAAIAQIEAIRHATSAPTYLAIPTAQHWWLDQYRDLRSHLERRCVVVSESPALALYLLEHRDASWGARFDDALQAFAARFNRDPAVLDWDSGLEVGLHFPEVAVFSPPQKGTAKLPYMDGTVDVVVVRGGDKAMLAEARRVASGLVVTARRGASLAVEWVGASDGVLPSVSIVIPTYNGAAFTQACVRSLSETVPGWLDAEFLVVDDGSTDGTEKKLAALARREPRLRCLRNGTNRGFISAANRGISESKNDIVLLLNNDTIALPGWLPPLLRVFAQRPDAGAVGGKLVYPNGRLQEAGCAVFSDGRAAQIGKGHLDPSDPLFDYVREVDYVSGAHLAFRRSFLQTAQGLDERYSPAYYEDTDICFRVREEGLKVYYQPESVVVHVEGGSSGTDESAGVKRHQVLNRQTFVARWEHALPARPAYPARFDLETLHRLAVREAD